VHSSCIFGFHSLLHLVLCNLLTFVCLCRARRAARRLADIDSWEKSKAAQMEAQLEKIHVSPISFSFFSKHTAPNGNSCDCVVDNETIMQEHLEMKKAARAEKLRNAAAKVRREAEEKRAAAEARRGEEAVKAGEAAARYRDTGRVPSRKIFGAGLFGRG
jgi:hypothetical protein